MKKETKCQLNVYINKSWKPKLEKIAREKSYKEERNVTLLDLIRETLNNVYHLDEVE